MAVFHVEFSSEKLGMRSRLNVLLPENAQPNLPILLLLHGLGDDENAWLEQTKIADYARDQQVAVIMPRADRSYYTNTVSGMHYFDYISEEVVARCRQWFSLSAQPDDTYVGGLSMGGYGALKCALLHPEIFAGAFSLSGVPDIVEQWREHPERTSWYTALFGKKTELAGSTNDVVSVVQRWPANQKRPFLWQLCGTEDPFLRMNERFHTIAQQSGFENSLELVAGAHEWRVWDGAIQEVLPLVARKTKQ
ncbi:alpha/beta hydrolase [Schleiferilactobacillus harbinensis]|uniref:alpha/beta hydrolase n=1 Tax=Schleiferilactobacillus harbinensis TaxID=304207 RepID=UPI0011753B56|nr:alpha/beta fold hydrolase [Schleiferilactobacillus harbinensis]GEK06577.1 esterase [Schleiferilactobacillus harbinensis]